jgi:hypothetical protein
MLPAAGGMLGGRATAWCWIRIGSGMDDAASGISHGRQGCGSLRWMSWHCSDRGVRAPIHQLEVVIQTLAAQDGIEEMHDLAVYFISLDFLIQAHTSLVPVRLSFP